MSDKNNFFYSKSHIVFIILFFLVSNGFSTQKETVEKKIEVEKQARVIKDTIGYFIDFRDGGSYTWVRLLDGKKWMSQNLNYESPDSWCYDNEKSNCAKHGRLYTWETAIKACPDGWRLPTDNEWRNMTKIYGGCDDDASDKGKAANTALLLGGKSGFSALLSGNRFSGGQFFLLSEYGTYWSATERSVDYAWLYYFKSSNGSVNRDIDSKESGNSCRCLQD